MIHLYGWDWVIPLVTEVYIHGYRDGNLLSFSGTLMPIGISIHLDVEDNNDILLRATFPNLTTIDRHDEKDS